MRRIIAENYAYVWPNGPHLWFPFGQGDIWWVAKLKATYKVLHFSGWLNVLYLKDCELHASCGSSSGLGNVLPDSSGDLAPKSQLSSPKVIQDLNAFKPARDSNFHNSISQMLSWHLWWRMWLPLLLMHIKNYTYIVTWETISCIYSTFMLNCNIS